MRGYGLPRHSDVEFPDKADITKYGLNMERRRNVVSARRRWKKVERLEAKKNIRNQII